MHAKRPLQARAERDRRELEDTLHHPWAWILAAILSRSSRPACSAASRYLRFGREHATGTAPKYTHEPPDDLAPALVPSLLAQHVVAGGDQMAATLFELVRRGRYKMTPVTREESTLLGLHHKEVDDVDLTRGDESIDLSVVETPVAAIFDKLTEEGPAALSHVAKTVKDLPETTGSGSTGARQAFESAVGKRRRQRKFWSGPACVVKWLRSSSSCSSATASSCSASPASPTRRSCGSDLILTAIGVALRTRTPSSSCCFRHPIWRRRRPKLQASAERWDAFRRYLRDFPRLADKPADSLVLWERLLVFGIAFGIADRVLEAAAFISPASTTRRHWRPGAAEPAVAAATTAIRRRSSAPTCTARSDRVTAVAAVEAAAEGTLAVAAAVPGDDAVVNDDERHRALQALAVEADAAAQRCLLAGDRAGAEAHLRVAEQRYRESWEVAPPGGYGRLVGMLKAAILHGDADGAARHALAALALGTESPTAAYALALACLAAGDDVAAGAAAGQMANGGEAFERTAAALGALARRDEPAYAAALRAVIADFEARDLHLTGVPIADTALVLERLAELRGLAQRPVSPLLPLIRSRAASSPRGAPAPSSPRRSSPASTSCAR